ncbi:hypothetical protein E2C01_016350 [Portunus trituberculatus]|uniref:Uncharacterized protein n=1 Tax=Portunus trituberculatus TaxID=210409 RepID=A0A5B7DQT9_PORTR|nr:hypothetical protein [Portunus trituberculatus]
MEDEGGSDGGHEKRHGRRWVGHEARQGQGKIMEGWEGVPKGKTVVRGGSVRAGRLCVARSGPFIHQIRHGGVRRLLFRLYVHVPHHSEKHGSHRHAAPPLQRKTGRGRVVRQHPLSPAMRKLVIQLANLKWG